MRLKEGQLWIHRDSDETVDKILRVDKAHCYSNVAKCWTENSHGVCGDANYSPKELLTDSRWQIAEPWAMFNALCMYYFKPSAVVEPEPYVVVWFQSGLPIAIRNVSAWIMDENFLTFYDKNNTVITKFKAEEVHGVVEKRG
ncbi:MAG: hypothetical protein Q4Q51_03720 [Eubacteriales bacterium]|nr:hypothetical protein [Eubacteriales bacterium]